MAEMNARRRLRPKLAPAERCLWLGVALGIARRAVDVRWKRLAIQHDVALKTPDGLSVLDLYQRNRDLVPGLEGIVRPSLPAYGWRSTGLDNPVLHFTAFIFCIELQPTVWIGPNPFGYGSRYRHLFVIVVGRVPVACPYWKRACRH